MKKRNLFIINTYAQLIVAMHLNNTLLKDCDNVVLISDHSSNACNVVDALNKNNIFTKSFFIKTKGFVNGRSERDKVIDAIQISVCKKNRYAFYLDGIENLYFDEILVYNFLIDIYGLFSVLSEFNPNIRISFFEETPTTYDVSLGLTNRRKLINTVRRSLGKKIVTSAINKFYCFYPQLYTGEIETVGLSRITRDSLTAIQLREVFGVKDDNQYKEKFIFFSGVLDFEGGKPIGEFELVEKIASIVGKCNILIKTHPRDTRGIYEQNGYRVDKNSSIPWEAIQLSNDFSDKVFMTSTSNSVLAGSLLSDSPVRTYYFYKLCKTDENYTAIEVINGLQRLLSNKDLRELLYNVHICDNLEEAFGKNYE